jgi:hypothetical protein
LLKDCSDRSGSYRFFGRSVNTLFPLWWVKRKPIRDYGSHWLFSTHSLRDKITHRQFLTFSIINVRFCSRIARTVVKRIDFFCRMVKTLFPLWWVKRKPIKDYSSHWLFSTHSLKDKVTHRQFLTFSITNVILCWRIARTEVDRIDSLVNQWTLFFHFNG